MTFKGFWGNFKIQYNHMEKIINSKSLQILPVKIYLDDLEKVINILNEDESKEIEIRTKEYKLTLDELKNKYLNESLNYLEIHRSNPYLTVEFNYGFSNNGVRIYSNDNSSSSIGIIEKIKNIIKPKRKFFNLLLGKYNINLSVLYVIFWIISGIFFKELITKDNYIISFLLYFTLSAMLMIPFFNKNSIILNYKRNRLNFFIRKKDDLFLIIISTIIGYLIGYITK